MMYNPPHPGEVFNELYLKPSGMTVEQASRRMMTQSVVLKPWRKMQADYDWWQLR